MVDIGYFRLALILAHGYVLFSLSSGASVIDRQAGEQVAVVSLLHNQNEIRTDDQLEYGIEEDYYFDEDDYLSGDYENQLPKVAFSTKSREESVVLDADRRRQGRRKGLGKKRDPCLKKYKGYCIHGACRYLRELRTPSCVCQVGYSGERCHLFSLPVTKAEGGYNRTVALAVVAVVLSLLCLTVIGFLLAVRYHKQGEREPETEDKAKLETPTYL